MAYNPNRPPSGPHRSTPLIARPSANSHQNSVPPRPAHAGMPANYLGNMLGGALAGMGYPSSHLNAYAHPPPPSHSNPYYPPPPPAAYAHPYSYPPQGSYPSSAYPSTSTAPSPYPSLPSRPSHSALPPAPAPSSSSSSARDATHSRGAAPSPRRPGPAASSARPTEFACQLATCSFVSKNRRTTREHEEDRHLLFEPGREPKPWSGSLKPLEGAVIEGTGISLDTPEAVAKWIADRKKRWPSKKVVEDKEKARAERIKAGLEEAPRERGSGARGRGRGRGRGGGYGAGSGPGREREADEPARKKLKTEQGPSRSSSPSGSSSSSSSSSSGSDGEEDSDDEVSKEALKALLGKEAEDDEDDEGSDADDGPVEEASSRPPGATAEEPPSDPTSATKKQFQVVCRHWRKGQCALGDTACPYLHTIPADQPLPAPRRNRPHPRAAPHNPFARPFRDAFELLEEQEVKHVVSDVLQVVDFLRANAWLRGVELRVGQMDEESGIEVVDAPQGETSLPREGIVVDEAPLEGGAVDPDEGGLASRSMEAVVPEPTIVAPPPPRTGGLGLVADYSSDEDDEDGEELVKQALLS
ncbi:hypothetical protein JCM11491_006350 [Sporobolomyces phaffii]